MRRLGRFGVRASRSKRPFTYRVIITDTGPLPPNASITRATNATYFDSSGALTTASSGVARFDYDPSTLAARGLLIEEQRTNLLLNSLADGTNLSTQNVAVSATAYTLSFFGTGTVTLSGASTAGPLVGTDATTKVRLTFTPSAGTLTCTVSGTVKWANLEAGSFATSFIPTAGASATRNADQVVVSTLTPWFNATEGTVVVEFSEPSIPSADSFVVQFDDGTASNRHAIYVTGGAASAFTTTGGVVQSFLGLGANVGGTNYKVAYAYKVNDFAASKNGGAVGTDAAGTLPTPTALRIGSNQAPTGFLNGYLRRMAYYNTRLSNAQLQALST